MPFVSNGTVVQQRSFLQELLELPSQIYALICFFFATLFNAEAARQKGAPRRNTRKDGHSGTGTGSGNGRSRPMGRVRGPSSINGGGG